MGGKALVLGRGSSGRAAAAELVRRGFSVEFAEGFDVVVASPGVPVKSELQLGCEELKRRGWKLLAVTGSKGKSSVVKAVADAINLAGGRAVPCGNYGRPVCELVGEEPGWAVVEVSSFQLETTQLAAGTFEAAALLNVQEDHLDRHGDITVYHSLKRRLSSMAKKFFDSVPDPAYAGRLVAGSYFDNGVLRANGAYAAALMRTAGLDDVQIRRAFEAFEPLPHRFQTVGEFGGVRFIDDSKATSIEALAAGVAMCGASPVRLIAGGLLKGDDPKNAVPILTERVKKVYLIGQGAETLSAAWGKAADCEVCGTLARAVECATRDAVSGETVLLSPGAASFDQFQNFGERGDVFAGLATKEGQRKKMNKYGIVFGAAAVAVIAGCKDPDYKYTSNPSQTEVKQAGTDSRPASFAPVVVESAPEKRCTCAPGTVHERPCVCGAANCACAVAAKPVVTADLSTPVVAQASASAAAPVAGASEAETTVYVVQRGDYLSKISKKFNITIAAIKKLNPSIKADNVVRIGQKLKLPGKVDVGVQAEPAKPVAKAAAKAYAPYTGATKEYVVKSGDTLGGIAYSNGINIRQLKELNGLQKDTLRVGQKLKIPADKVAAAKSAPAAAPKKSAPAKSAAAPAAKVEAPAATEPAGKDKPLDAAALADEVATGTIPAAPAAEAPAAEASASAAPAATYVVQEGDDMTGVSIRWGVSAAEIRELNNLGEKDQLVPGQIIKLPADAQQ